ncbi:endonuclease/exonuclease/phosphatase family protein [Selenomonas sp. CM52]|uniref:endonuclease/exonuclease/phosphatase family protein n=2 Tax=Selenomonas TaxID=970 RepID=UPI00027C57CB|nr:endonuclease/exonuclease/phosphatase family protein [Selenomonas sp. CM52]EJU26599.1 endonuclease/exonuclease/phosphatase family protein [Selenomonas sp. CM52]
MSYRIGSFNLKNLGQTAMGKEHPRDLSKIAEIIRKEDFDVVALQEVLSEGKALSLEQDMLKRSILYELGTKEWGFAWAHAESETDPRSEGYAFLWKKKRFRLPVAKLKDGTKRTFYPRICRLRRDLMTRKPYYARFVGRGGSYFEIRLLCVHTHFTDRDQRRQELDNLLKEVYPQVEDRIYYKGRPSYTIVLGDYNAELRRALNISGFYVADIETANRWGGKKIQTVQNEKTTLKRNFDNGGQDVDTSTCVGEGYANNYDHFSYDLERFSGIHIDVKRIDAVATYCGGDFETYFKTVSDHVPIIMTMSLK